MSPCQQHARHPSLGLRGSPLPLHAAQSNVEVILSSSGSLGGELQSQVGATDEGQTFFPGFNVQEDAQLQEGNSQLGLNTIGAGKIVILAWGDHLFQSLRAASGFSAGCSSPVWARDEQGSCHAPHMSPVYSLHGRNLLPKN